MTSPAYTLVIHGGAGTIPQGSLSPEQEQHYYDALNQALRAGNEILSAQGSALEAVETAVTALENCPLFNAGRGSVYNHEGKQEMDAAIMNGRDLKAGSVAGISRIKNPVKLARAVMEKSEHVMLIGQGAEVFAELTGIPFEDVQYFHSDYRWKQLQEIRNTDKTALDHTEKKFGTVGAVARDSYGNLAAATSTGGMTNKKWGRIGDTPIIGAGTYANNQTCAISCTGHGEYFIRAVVAYDIHCLMEYKGMSLTEACDLVVRQKLVKMGGEGGLIAVDRNGLIAMPFNSEGMYRGWITDLDSETAIFRT